VSAAGDGIDQRLRRLVAACRSVLAGRLFSSPWVKEPDRRDISKALRNQSLTAEHRSAKAPAIHLRAPS